MSDSQQEITPELIDRLLKVKKMTAKDLADMLNVSEATVHRWRKPGGNRPTGTAAAVLAALLASSGILSIGASTGGLGVAGAAGIGAGVGAIGGPVSIAVGAAAGVPIGLAVSGYKLFKNMDSSFKEADPNNQVMKELEHWAKSQEDLQKEKERREVLANELKEAERRIKELERQLSGEGVDESEK